MRREHVEKLEELTGVEDARAGREPAGRALRRGGRLPRGVAPAGMADGATHAALHAGRSGPRDRRGRPSPRRKARTAASRPSHDAARPSAAPCSERRAGARRRKAPCETAPGARAPGRGRSRGFSGRRTVGRGVLPNGKTTRPRAPGKAYLRAARQRREGASAPDKAESTVMPLKESSDQVKDGPPSSARRVAAIVTEEDAFWRRRVLSPT